ncbi:hypothetical protein [Metabacillus fastidiosus]|uniref:DUF2642 domain-containing protein n=1 Tax=Metabacillus fastidiosus TaxID=1458 RepID=A0ABU6P503_9BACI|nr:hypothetical protein [Metabacillus fastidiosus]MED4403629.1 hypothetical protein [Metabacillus fastidiosus]MED4463644.1 hypothetical protein [Metabacillus fastidiosus]
MDLNINFPTINNIHDEALIQEFKQGVGAKIFVLTPSYPFVFIGIIQEVVEDYVVIDVETTTISELENRQWFLHIDQIEVFYIEQIGKPRIPELRID